jgi:hypothetical protein
MDEKNKSGWYRDLPGKLQDKWPRDGSGDFEEAAFLKHCTSVDLADEMLANMLDAYGVPCVRRYPGDGGLGRVMLGMSGMGTDLFVPKSMLETAKNCAKEYLMKRTYKEEYQHWLDSPALNEQEWEELNSIADDDGEIKSRFFAPLEFGTAGLRGTMKLGLHHMNVHVIRHVTQSFANVIKNEGGEAMEKGVVVDFDCRVNSDVFAREAACVMAANGIHVRIFPSLHPTPELSFAVRHFGAEAGINITASHNPKEYNGYKVYWSDGAQLPPQHAAAIARQMEEIDIFTGFTTCDYDEAVSDGRIEVLTDATDEAFLQNVMSQAIDREAVARVADDFKIVYTPFHGCGYKLVPEALKRLGIKHLYPVPEQMVIDGTFPTVQSPNPENPEGFYLAVDLAKKVGSDLIIGTDPDSDRIGVMVRAGDGLQDHHGQPDGRSAAGLYNHGPEEKRHPAEECGRCEEHRHHRDGAGGLRQKRRPYRGHLHRLQVHGRAHCRVGGCQVLSVYLRL